MQPRTSIIIAFIVLLLTIIVYVVSFFGIPLSNETSDWGAFGSYMGIGISALSIALIYVTYNEQRRTNQISGFEQHLSTISNTIENLIDKNSETVKAAYSRFIEHFKVQLYDLSSCTKKKVEGVCTYYYSLALENNGGELYYLFEYINDSLSFIKEDKSISDKEKSRRIKELACAIPESVRFLFLCWKLTDNQDLLEYCYSNGFFMLGEPKNNLLEDIITFVCTGKRPPKRKQKAINPKDIVLEYDPKEQFHDTYERLYNTKTKQQ